MSQNVCPVWVGYLLLNPLRKLIQRPEKILSPYVTEGMTILDIGSAMGYFSIPMAQMTGENGTVVCVDIQKKMLEKLSARARKFRVEAIIETVVSDEKSLNIDGYNSQVDFAMAFYVAHEVPDRERFFTELFYSLKPGGKLLFSEPAGHVSENDFNESVEYAKWCGFKITGRPDIKKSRTVLLKK